jgi:hypothetical protein
MPTLTKSTRILGAAMVMRAGIDPIYSLRPHSMPPAQWASFKQSHCADADRLMEDASPFAEMSLPDVCREALLLDRQEVPYSRNEIIQRALSGGTLSNIFTNVANAQLMAAFDEESDTTAAWVSEVEVDNFKAVAVMDYAASTELEKLPRGGEANDASASDTGETYKVYRLARKFAVDEQDVLDDQFGRILQTPKDMGEAGRRARSNMVYGRLLANPTLAADNKAVFHTDHANLVTGSGNALSASTLQAGISAMGQQKKGDTLLSIAPRFLLVPGDSQWCAEILIKSTQRIVSTAGEGTYNPLLNREFQIIIEPRLGALGFVDPFNNTTYTGAATHWYLASRPGRTVQLAFLRNTGRVPTIRPYMLTEGKWGVGWDIKYDIGATILDYRGLYKSTGV